MSGRGVTKVREASKWNEQEIKEEILALLTEKYGSEVDFTIDLQADIDSEGDDILRVTIVVEPFAPVLDHPPTELAYRLRGKLSAHRVTEFPIISYISKKDAGKRKRAAA